MAFALAIAPENISKCLQIAREAVEFAIAHPEESVAQNFMTQLEQVKPGLWGRSSALFVTKDGVFTRDAKGG